MRLGLFVLCSILFSFHAKAQIDLNKGLVLYLPFNGDTKDKSIYGNNAINYGAVPTADEYGRPNCAYTFNGTSYMEIPHSPSINVWGKELTMSVRVEPLSYNPDRCHASVLMAKDYDLKPGTYCMWFTSAQNSDCAVQDTLHQVYSGIYHNQIPSFSTIDNAPYIRTRQWDCLVFVTNGTVANMYVNGVLRHSFPVSGIVDSNTTALTLGRTLSTSYPHWFNGSMDEVRVYNRSLNTSEIDSLCKIKSVSTSINENTASLLPIFVNPVRDLLTMMIDNQDLGGELIIRNLNGVTVYQSNLTQNQVDVSRLSSGLYIIEYITERIILRNRLVKID